MLSYEACSVGAEGSAQKHEPSTSSKPSCLARRRATESGAVHGVARSGCFPGGKYIVNS